MPDLRRKYEITEAEGSYELFTEPSDVGDKQVGPKVVLPPRMSGVLSVGRGFANPEISESVDVSTTLTASESISESVEVEVT